VTPGVHDFVARVAGDTAAYSSVYTNSTGLPFLPHQMLVARAYYTLIVAGVIPASGQIPNNTVPFVALLDDPFPGATVGDTTQARITLVNAAPFASASGTGQTVVWYVTPGATPPAVLTNYPAMGAAAYRAASQPININPGQYTVTVKAGANVVAQQSITVTMGEVRTLVLQSTGYAATPGIANHQLISLTKSAQ
jgi:hypothetical protein